MRAAIVDLLAGSSDRRSRRSTTLSRSPSGSKPPATLRMAGCARCRLRLLVECGTLDRASTRRTRRRGPRHRPTIGDDACVRGRRPASARSTATRAGTHARARARSAHLHRPRRPRHLAAPFLCCAPCSPSVTSRLPNGSPPASTPSATLGALARHERRPARGGCPSGRRRGRALRGRGRALARVRQCARASVRSARPGPLSGRTR